MDKNLFFYELEGRGYIFQNKKWDEAKHVFEDDMLNMAWEMWSSAKHSVKAQAVPEPSIDLTGHDIKYIINFMCYEDPDNLDTEVTIQKCKSGFDGAGLYAWVSEYPEEGGIKLGEAQEQSHD